MWFNDLKVSEYENCMKLKNLFPVISISMKDPIVDIVKDFMDKMKVKLVSPYADFEYLKKTTGFQNLYAKYTLMHLLKNLTEPNWKLLC